MAPRQLALPVARVVQPVAGVGEVSAGAENERLLLVDLEKLRRTKTYAKLKAQAPDWDDEARDNYLLALMCQGPA